MPPVAFLRFRPRCWVPVRRPALHLLLLLLLLLLLAAETCRANHTAHLDAFIDTWQPFAGEGAAPAVSSTLYPPVRFDDRAVDVDVAVVAIFKDELPYLQEWLEYHLLIGVGRFFLVPNVCEEDEWWPYVFLLQTYIDAGTVVVLEQFRCSTQFQVEAYNEAYKLILTQKVARWVGFFDMDEFMVPALATQTISDVLADPTFVQSAAASAIFPRLLFGSGDHVFKPAGSVLASYVHHLNPYTRKAREAPRRNIVELGKTFVRVGRCAPGMVDVHVCDPEGWVATSRERQCGLALASSRRSIARRRTIASGPGTAHARVDGPHRTPAHCDWGGVRPLVTPTSCKEAVHAAATVPARGDPAYCGHGWSFRHGWFAHYYTKSRQEFEDKNARGDAFFASRKKVAPSGSSKDVLNHHVIDSVRQRLRAMRARAMHANDGTMMERATWLEGLLLHGAPTLHSQRAAEARMANFTVTDYSGAPCMNGVHWPRVWSPSFIAAGQQFLAATSTFTVDPRRGLRCGVDVQHRCHRLHKFESRRMDSNGTVAALARRYKDADGSLGLDFSYDSRS